MLNECKANVLNMIFLTCTDYEITSQNIRDKAHMRDQVFENSQPSMCVGDFFKLVNVNSVFLLEVSLNFSHLG